MFPITSYYTEYLVKTKTVFVLAEYISSGGWDAVVGTNLYGTWNCMQEAFEQYMRDNGGQIVNIVTMNKTGMGGMSHTSQRCKLLAVYRGRFFFSLIFDQTLTF